MRISNLLVSSASLSPGLVASVRAHTEAARIAYGWAEAALILIEVYDAGNTAAGTRFQPPCRLGCRLHRLPSLDPASRPDVKYFTGRVKAAVLPAADSHAALGQLHRRIS